MLAGTDYGSKMEGYGKDLADKSNSEAHVTAAVTVSVLRVVSGMLALAECQSDSDALQVRGPCLFHMLY